MKISFNKNWYIATETSQPIAVDLKNKQFSVYSISDAHVGTWKITFEYRIANEPLASNYRLNDANQSKGIRISALTNPAESIVALAQEEFLTIQATVAEAEEVFSEEANHYEEEAEEEAQSVNLPPVLVS